MERVGGAFFNRTKKQNAEIQRVAKRTANLKKEQYRIIDRDGNVLLMKKGIAHEVAATVGEKRELLKGNISIHNHPSGGTFSADDLSDFGYGAKEIVAASPEGTYSLVNTNVGKPNQYEGWLDLKRAMENDIQEVSTIQLRREARDNLRNSKTAKELRAIEDRFYKIQSEQGNAEAQEYITKNRQRYDSLVEQNTKEIDAEYRRLEVKPYDDYLKKNAKKYGFKYTFTPF